MVALLNDDLSMSNSKLVEFEAIQGEEAKTIETILGTTSPESVPQLRLIVNSNSKERRIWDGYLRGRAKRERLKVSH
jgi:hypothetical protein